MMHHMTSLNFSCGLYLSPIFNLFGYGIGILQRNMRPILAVPAGAGGDFYLLNYTYARVRRIYLLFAQRKYADCTHRLKRMSAFVLASCFIIKLSFLSFLKVQPGFNTVLNLYQIPNF